MDNPAAESTTPAARSVSTLRPDVLPLPFTAFEHYLMLEDTVERPMSSYFEFQFSTGLDRDALRDSLMTAVHRNPLFASRAVRHGSSWEWHYDPDHVPQLLGQSDPVTLAGRPIHIDLEKEVGIRFWYIEQPNGSELVVQVHHACSDGVGVRRLLIIDALNEYAQKQTGMRASERWDRLDPSLLLERGVFSGKIANTKGSTHTALQKMRNTWYFLFKLPDSLHKSGIVKPTDRPLPIQPTCHRELSERESEQILERVKREQLSINDVALALLFHTCWKWNLEFGGVKNHRNLRILMPFDLRGRSDLRMPATNRMSFAFLGRKYAQCFDWSTLLESVRKETSEIKESRLPLDFVCGLESLMRRPRLMKWLVKRNKHMSTIVLTYLGDYFRGLDRSFPVEDGERIIGGARLNALFIAPPVRVNTHLSLGLVVNWGKICISAAWDRIGFTESDANLFLARFAHAWNEWAKCGYPDQGISTFA